MSTLERRRSQAPEPVVRINGVIVTAAVREAAAVANPTLRCSRIIVHRPQPTAARQRRKAELVAP